MKKLMFMILLLTCLALTSAVAEDAAFSIIQEELLRQDKMTDLIEPEVANALVTKLEDAGIPISLNAISSDQPIYKYDFTRMLLQEAWGEYYDWSIEKKHLFDELMVSAGQLPYCYHLLPDASEISQESALRIAFSAIKTRYGVSDTELNAADVTGFLYSIGNQNRHVPLRYRNAVRPFLLRAYSAGGNVSVQERYRNR